MVKKKKESKKKSGKKEAKKSFKDEVNEYSLKLAISFVLFALAIVVVLSAFSLAGKFGNWFYENAHKALGFAFWFLPLSLLFAGYSVYSGRKKRFGLFKGGALFVFFLSTVALTETLFENSAGVLGALLAYPFVYAFGNVSGAIILFALAFASMVIAGDFDFENVFEKIKSKLQRRKDEYNLTEEEEEALDGLSSQENENQQQNKEVRIKNDANDEEELDTNNNKPRSGALTKAKEKIEEIFGADEKKYSLTNYKQPSLSYLRKDLKQANSGDTKASANAIKRTLANFGIQVEIAGVTSGSTVTRYALKVAEGIRLNKILSLQSNLELALAASPIRIEAPIPGKSLVGIEVPNKARDIVGLGSLLSQREFLNSEYKLPMALGKDIEAQAVFYDLAKAPHMIIAGATGAGKSVTVHNLIISMLYKHGPDMLNFIMVDPKRVELTLYNGIPHLRSKVITDPKRTILALKWLIGEMERRYDILEEYSLQNISDYHERVMAPFIEELEKARKSDDEELIQEMEENAPPKMPYIVTVIDELADIMQLYPKELEGSIVRIAQKARAVGIHLILATQRPDVRTITGLIKANVPTRLALKVPSQIDSRTILDQAGAEKLLGAGDMLFLSGTMAKPKRIQAPFVSQDEIKKVVKFLQKQADIDNIAEEIDFENIEKDTVAYSATLSDDDDERKSEQYQVALRVVIDAKKASTSFLQRKLSIGYNKAARFIDMMEEDGIVGPANGSKPRKVLVGPEYLNGEVGNNKENSEYRHENLDSSDADLIDEVEENKNSG